MYDSYCIFPECVSLYCTGNELAWAHAPNRCTAVFERVTSWEKQTLEGIEEERKKV